MAFISTTDIPQLEQLLPPREEVLLPEEGEEVDLTKSTLTSKQGIAGMRVIVCLMTMKILAIQEEECSVNLNSFKTLSCIYTDLFYK
ncbi:hypothetical protein OS493_029252 [Desmophyllum pertusum]|uniref:Uncharacterized protein n=1 Tax=Desmophyllum pertusum TaxID=174260 RepID=A0A9W9ZKD1_9CNID|nr:hypothetical protein OS493_029252 [Desmophyllum pertusum]